MRWPLVTAFLAAIIGGIFLAARFSTAPQIWLFIAFVGILALVYSLFWRNWLIPWLSLAIGIALAGFWFSQCRHLYLRALCANQLLNGRQLTLVGMVIQRPQLTEYGYQMRLKLSKTTRPSGTIVIYSTRPMPEVLLGRSIRCRGKFKTVATPIGSWPGYQEQQGITGSLRLDSQPVELAGSHNPWLFGADLFRTRLMAVGSSHLKGLNLRFLHAMLYGDPIGPEREGRKLQVALERTGTIHLLSVSGLHIGLVTGFFSLLLQAVRFPKRWRILPMMVIIAVYSLMTGLDPPVLRSGLMLFCYFAGELVTSERKPAIHRLTLAALILLIINPYHLFQLGFQLSFGATFGVVWLFPIIRQWVPCQHWIGKLLRDGTFISICAQLPILPILVQNFHQISWSSVWVNLLLMIPAHGIVVGGLIGELIGLTVPWLGGVALAPIDVLLTFARFMLQGCANPVWAASNVPSWPWPWVIAYYLCLLLILDWFRPNRLTGKPDHKLEFGKTLIVILVLGNLLTWTSYGYIRNHQDLQFTVIDVGQGDSLLLRAPDGFAVLVDAGNPGKGRQSVLPVLRSQGINYLNRIYISHGHRDHLGGISEILDAIPVGEICYPAERNNPELMAVIDIARELGVKHRVIARSEAIRWGSQITGQVFETLSGSVPDDRGDNERIDPNDCSLVMVLNFGKNTLLLTGDLSPESEEFLVRKYPQALAATILKVSHHGSNHSSFWPFLTQAQPAVALISVGAGNQFGHPGKNLLRRLASLGVPVFRTDLHGQIQLRIMPDRFQVATLRREDESR